MRRKRGAEAQLSGLGAAVPVLSGRYSRIAGFAILVLLAALPYTRSLKGEYLNWDDHLLVAKNTRIRTVSADNFRAIFTLTPGRTYQPIREFSYSLTNSSPLSHRVGNLLLHCLAAVLLFLLLIRILDALRPGYDNSIVALLGALLFACHPINVESVAWISSRKYGLLAFFSFLALYTHVVSGRKPLLSIASAIAVVLAALSSPFGIVLPAVILAFDLCKSVKPRMLWRENRLPYFCQCIALLIILPLVLVGLFGGESHVVESSNIPSPAMRVVQAFAVLADYAKHILLPFQLNAKYPAYGSTEMFLKALFALVAIGVCLWQVRKSFKSGNRLPLFCVLWFVLFWLPVSNLIPISTPIADRYMYLPAAGVFLAIAVQLDHRKCLIPAVVIILLLSILSFQRASVWQSSVSLWEDSLKKAPDNLLALDRYGDALRRAGRMDEAASQWQRALELNPDDPSAHRSMGAYRLWQKDRPAAIAHLERAVELDPSMASAWANLAACNLATRDYAKAEEQIRQAIRYKPVDMQYRTDLGIALLAQGKLEEALANFEIASADIAQCPRIADILQRTNHPDHAARFSQEAKLAK